MYIHVHQWIISIMPLIVLFSLACEKVFIDLAEVPKGSKYAQTVPDRKCLYPDRLRRKDLICRLSRVHQTFVCSCPDFCVFTRF